MSEVYRNARCNLIYLGEKNRMTKRAVMAVEGIMNDMRTATADLTLLPQTLRDGETGALLKNPNGGLDVGTDLKALQALFSRHWFRYDCIPTISRRVKIDDCRRLWVLQEVVLASSNICHWGTYTFDLFTAVGAATWISYKDTSPWGLDSDVGVSCASEMFDLLFVDHRFDKSWPSLLATMLYTARRFENTEPRDSIFAILGLLDQESCLGSYESSLIRVDYTKPIPDVFRDGTRYALCQTGDLHALRLVDHRSDILHDSQPCPTWTVQANEVHDALPLFNAFKACDGLNRQSSLGDESSDENVLLLEGILVDEVLQPTVTCLMNHWGDYREFHNWLISVRNIGMSLSNVANQEEPHLAMAFALTAGCTWIGPRAQSGDLQTLAAYLKSLTITVSDSFRTNKTFDYERVKSIRETHQLNYCLKRRFFVTAAGRMGLGPRCMQPEDIVVVLRGGKMPFVLRKKDDSYWLLGEAYVHGIMDGEAVQMHNARGGSEEVFHIR